MALPLTDADVRMMLRDLPDRGDVLSQIETLQIRLDAAVLRATTERSWRLIVKLSGPRTQTAVSYTDSDAQCARPLGWRLNWTEMGTPPRERHYRDGCSHFKC